MSEIIEGTALVLREERALAFSAPAPLVTPEEAKAAMASYFAICEAVLTPDDYQEFTQKEKIDGRWQSVTKRFKKKSAVKKLQTFWGVAVRVTEVVRDQLEDGNFGFRVTATAQTKDGREVSATGGCSTYEDRFTPRRYDDDTDAKYAARAKAALARSYHDVLSTAETRATNRAVMNCIGVGGGEVTADEISRPPRDEREREPARPPQQAAPPAKKPIDALFDRWHAQTGEDFAAFQAAMKGRKLSEIGASVEMLEIAAKRAPEAKPAPAATQAEPPARQPQPWELATPPQVKKMWAVTNDAGIDDAARKLIYEKLGLPDSSRRFTKEHATRYIDYVEATFLAAPSPAPASAEPAPPDDEAVYQEYFEGGR